jgi:hypothetical protein
MDEKVSANYRTDIFMAQVKFSLKQECSPVPLSPLLE